jgi:hypothetical protein
MLCTPNGGTYSLFTIQATQESDDLSVARRAYSATTQTGNRPRPCVHPSATRLGIWSIQARQGFQNGSPDRGGNGRIARTARTHCPAIEL